jgi:hypothetical protein
MNDSEQGAAPSYYTLRFASLFDRGRGYAFPCDADGHVDVDDLSDQCRSNYYHAWAAVGREFSAPVVFKTQEHVGTACAPAHRGDLPAGLV